MRHWHLFSQYLGRDLAERDMLTRIHPLVVRRILLLGKRVGSPLRIREPEMSGYGLGSGQSDDDGGDHLACKWNWVVL